MPLFELDDGRPRLVQPMQPLTGSFAQECASLLSHHLAAIAGEPLFAVRSRTNAPDHADLPELLALDATGRPVVVDVVQVVDDDAVISALRHAGAAARMTTTDLARAYHPDPSRFAVDYAAFREQAAFGTQSSRREGVRLVLLCSEVAAEAGDTLGFLRGPGRHVDVLQVGVVRGVDDRRLLDVSPLATHEGARRSVEPTALRLVRSSEGFAGGGQYEPHVPTTPHVRTPATGELRAVTPPMATPAVPAPTPLRAPTTAPIPQVGPKQPQRPTPAPQPAPEPAPVLQQPVVDKPKLSSSTVQEAPTTLTPVVGLRSAADQVVPRTPPRERGEPVNGPRPFAPLPAPLPISSSFPTTSTPASQSPPTRPAPQNPPALQNPAPPQSPVAPQNPAPPQSPPAAQRPAGHESTKELAPIRESWPDGAPRPLPELATLAKSRRAITTLVWVRERRGQRLLAMLRTDGLIELPTGELHADPDDAASAAVSAENPVDGWRAWRLGEGGPTLAEATGILRP
ncbi:hypothetical protein [Cellulomonas xylanilytica]|uniref:RAMA domain-containing protein n=1 Tax=Cellulomonas xylanilytica TaxID=233583 RepID=A0A510VB74_9CELL|nr:hypothetical protein [Cellulomonas xylanilytica]GEK22510.1 hypothetical protein CXY01_30300 [Cellulomonas xylanilytica]